MPPLSESLFTSTKISKICTNEISYLNDSSFWPEKDFFFFFSKWKLNKTSLIPVFWYFIKKIVLYDVEYGLNFDRNAKNVDVSKKSRGKP